jgi:putative ABC transport system permease protein
MTSRELVRLAMHALRANWMRGVLTALGVIIGVASLVTLTAISAGARNGLEEDLQRLGPNIVILDGEFVVQPDGTETATDRTLTAGDLEAVAQLPGVTAVAPRQNTEGLAVSNGRVQASPFLSGITPHYQQIHNYAPAQGRLLTGEDERLGRQVAVLGAQPARRLFPGGGAVGRSIRVLDREFTVVGVFSRKGNLGDENLDNQVFVPLTVAKRVLFGGENVRSASVQVASHTLVPEVMDAIDELLYVRHRILPGRGEDFGTEDQTEIITTAQAATSTFETLTLGLGAIALIVGGIGIMNIMLVSVTERTREIGIRKAVGAEPSHIQAQFLVEALALCAVGGIIGVAVGLGSASFISNLSGWETLVDPLSLLVALCTAFAVGIVFGYYPARRAARLPAAVAMRFE